MPPVIEVEGLTKVFRVKERAPGLSGAMRSLLRPVSREVTAVSGIDFEIAAGERVAFIGPNGAGKSTTIKVLSGILHPTAGRVTVTGLVPWRSRRVLGYRIGTVFGQRSQLWYHLPAADTFELLMRIYDQDPIEARRRRARYVETFGIGHLLDRPVRQLSLGERMRCEVVASLLHGPSVLFLDEPTIGLDVEAKTVIRDLVRDESEQSGRTLLFTSHDTGDMERVCDRVIVIHCGRLLLDEPIAGLRRRYIGRKRVTVHTAEESFALELAGVRVRRRAPHRTELEVDLGMTSIGRLVSQLIASTQVTDLSVEDPPMEEIIRAIYRAADGSAPRESAASCTAGASR